MNYIINKRFENYYDKYNELSDVKKDKPDQKFKPINLRPKNMIMMDVYKRRERI